LTGSGGDGSVESTGLKLGFQHVVDLARQTSLLEFAENRLGLFLGGFSGGFFRLGSSLASLGDGLTVVGLVPLTEGGGIDLDDGALDEGVSSDQLVVGRVVDDADDTSLTGDPLGAPGKVAGFESQGTVLQVATTHSDRVDSLGAQLGHRRLSAQLKFSLLAVLGPLGPGGRALVSRVSRNTHLEGSLMVSGLKVSKMA